MTTNLQAFRVAPEGLDLYLRVTPNASQDEVVGLVKRDDGAERLQVRVRAVPDKGKANKAVIQLLAKQFGIPKSKLEIVSGAQSRQKVARIHIDTPEELLSRIINC